MEYNGKEEVMGNILDRNGNNSSIEVKKRNEVKIIGKSGM